MIASAGAGAFARLGAAPVITGESDPLGPLLPTRPYGATGERLTLMGVGGYHLGLMDEKEVPAMIDGALESGIRFFDNAWSYNRGRSEELYGRYLKPAAREHCFVMTKAEVKPGRPNAAEQLDESLRRMQTDYVDLWLTHAISRPDDAENRIHEMLDMLERAREQGKVRHYGFSGHFRTHTLLHAANLLKDRPGTACLLPVSPVDFAAEESFTRRVLPELLENRHIPIAMKALGSGRAIKETVNGRSVIGDRLSLEENYWFVLSLPVCSWVSGMESLEQLKQNTDIARRFTALSESDRIAIAEKVADVADETSLRPYYNWGG